MDTYAKAVNMLKKAITNAINKAIENGELPQAELPQFIIETPADRTHGDFATNAAMAGAKAFRRQDRDLSTSSSVRSFIQT